MSGSKFLLDTNIVIGLLKGHQIVLGILQDHAVELDICAHSFITRIELLSYPGITEAEVQGITRILQIMRYLPMTQAIEDMTIQFRRQYSLKIPDAIIAATAKVTCLELLTLDQQLANRMSEILEQTE
ncbi:hypothetical protein XM38_027160 [Halomicronema hongdechloris C2206]|uniref:PIN domain-containing protein n=1 Tax=Halomicronema hongdechloris C2206 TaxID=1641165 RepID=A0A1Z3HN95_9CYAN|nr:type II toxin-antitoxin system VapC family toxin [Halomicronema hongdechloris]ASC71762.1 hypothetical protein XM38_027160 [Halomicronema hongdechloris C2206]